MLNPEKLNAMKKLREELKQYQRSPVSNFGITVGLFDDDNIFEWKCTILGPKDTPYSGGLFILKIKFPENYPKTKPEVVFLTPIYHLNVKYFTEHADQPLGHICVNSLNDWEKKPDNEKSILKVLPELFTLMMKNNPDSPYDSTTHIRRNEFINNRKLFNEKAKYFTKKYANPNVKVKDYPNGWDFTYP